MATSLSSRACAEQLVQEILARRLECLVLVAGELYELSAEGAVANPQNPYAVRRDLVDAVYRGMITGDCLFCHWLLPNLAHCLRSLTKQVSGLVLSPSGVMAMAPEEAAVRQPAGAVSCYCKENIEYVWWPTIPNR